MGDGKLGIAKWPEHNTPSQGCAPALHQSQCSTEPACLVLGWRAQPDCQHPASHSPSPSLHPAPSTWECLTMSVEAKVPTPRCSPSLLWSCLDTHTPNPKRPCQIDKRLLFFTAELCFCSCQVAKKSSPGDLARGCGQ